MRPPVVSVFVCNVDKLAANELCHECVATQGLFQAVALIAEIGLLATNLHLLKLSQITQFQIENGVCLNIRQREARHQFRLGFILLANDADNFINIEIGNQVAL